MARRAGSANGLFAAAEAVVINLYDGGVLSPAVLERVIAGFADSAIDWRAPPDRKSVDGKSLHEVVAITMMPGRAIRNPSKEFLTIIEHVGGGSVAVSQREEQPEEQPESESDDELMDQLAGMSGKRASASKKAAKSAPASARKSAPSRGFNPLFQAAPPGRTRKS